MNSCRISSLLLLYYSLYCTEHLAMIVLFCVWNIFCYYCISLFIVCYIFLSLIVSFSDVNTSYNVFQIIFPRLVSQLSLENKKKNACGTAANSIQYVTNLPFLNCLLMTEWTENAIARRALYYSPYLISRVTKSFLWFVKLLTYNE